MITSSQQELIDLIKSNPRIEWQIKENDGRNEVTLKNDASSCPFIVFEPLLTIQGRNDFYDFFDAADDKPYAKKELRKVILDACGLTEPEAN